MKTIKVHPDLLDQLRDLVVAQPVVGFVLLVVLTGLFAAWAK